ncbi:MAG: hypothetical protein K2N03_07805 [Muribaculaceae bacterium]|nr:hypothetical protein [Muribaculaceae bacterium]
MAKDTRAKIPIKLKDGLIGLIFTGVIALLVWSGITAWNHFMKTPPYIDPEKYPILGIDISSHNGDIDMQKVAEAGVSFVFIKASEGSDFRDNKFEENYHKAKKAGLKTGAYHFFRFDKDGVDQALNLTRAIGHRKLDLGVAIDVETHRNASGIDSVDIARRILEMTDFLNMVGYRVTFYSNREGYYNYLRESVPGMTLWICSFSSTPINAEWTFWQFDHRGKMPGIEGDVDLDVFCGNLSEWKNYLMGALWPYDKSPGGNSNSEVLLPDSKE